jgi:uncharacterized membrane protein
MMEQLCITHEKKDNGARRNRDGRNPEEKTPKEKRKKRKQIFVIVSAVLPLFIYVFIVLILIAAILPITICDVLYSFILLLFSLVDLYV